MPKIPVRSGQELVKLLHKIGFEVDHQQAATSFYDKKNSLIEDLLCLTTKKSQKGHYEQSSDKPGIQEKSSLNSRNNP